MNREINRIRAIIGVDDELENAISTLAKALELAEMIARMTLDDEHDVEDSEALHSLIVKAREITGLSEPEDEETGDCGHPSHPIPCPYDHGKIGGES